LCKFYVTAYQVFGHHSFTIISQEFHNQRALFITYQKNIKAIAYNAKSVNWYYGFRTYLRERLVRLQVVLDIFVLNNQPKFLGKKIRIE
jgi:SanA protein